MKELEELLGLQAKTWTTLDGLQALRRDGLKLIADIKATTEKHVALLKIHRQNEAEIRSSPVASLFEFKSLKEGTRRLESVVKSNIQKAREVNKELTRLENEIKANQTLLNALEARAVKLQRPCRVLEITPNEDEGSSKAN